MDMRAYDQATLLAQNAIFGHDASSLLELPLLPAAPWNRQPGHLVNSWLQWNHINFSKGEARAGAAVLCCACLPAPEPSRKTSIHRCCTCDMRIVCPCAGAPDA